MSFSLMAIEAVCWISSGAAEPQIPGGIIPRECRSLPREAPHTGLGGRKRRRRVDKGLGRGKWEASGEVWGPKQEGE